VSWKRAGIAAGLLAAVLALVAFGHFPQDPLRRFLERRLSVALGGRVTVARVHVVPARMSAELSGLVVDAADYRLEVDRVGLVTGLATLWSGIVDLHSLEVGSPRLTLRASTASEPPSTLLRLRIARLDLTGGTLSYAGTRSVAVSGVTAHGSVGEGALDLAADTIAWQEPRPAEGSLSARLRITPALDAVLEASAFDTTGLHVELTGPLGPLTDPHPDLRITARATLPEALGLASDPAPDVRGRLNLAAQLQGTLASPKATGTLTGDALQIFGWKVETATAVADYRGDVATLEVDAQALGGSLTAHGEKRGPNVVARLTARRLSVPGVGRVSAQGRAAGPLEGSLAVDASTTLDGAQAALRYELRSQAQGHLRLADRTLDLAWSADASLTAPQVERLAAHGAGTARGPWPSAIEGQLSGSARVVRPGGPLDVPLSGSIRSQGGVARLELAAQPGTGQLDVDVDLSGSRPQRLRASGRGLDLALLDPRAGGTLSLELALSDPLGVAAGQGRLDLESVVWNATDLGNLSLILAAHGGVIDAQFAAPGLNLSGDARRAGPRAQSVTGHVVLDSMPLDVVARAAGQAEVTGAASAQGRFEIPLATPGGFAVHASIDAVALGKGDYSARTEAPFAMEATADTLRVDGLRVLGNGATLSLDGTLSTAAAGRVDLRARVSSDFGALPLPEGTTAQGQFSGELTLSGTPRRPLATGELTLAGVVVAVAGLPTVAIPAAAAQMEGETLLLPTVTANVAGGSVAVEGAVPLAAVWRVARADAESLAKDEAAHLDVRWSGVDLPQLLREAAPRVAEALVAQTSGEAHAEGGLADMSELHGSARIALEQVHMNGLAVSVTPIELRLAERKVSAAEVALTAANASLTLGGEVDLASRKLEGSGKGRIDLRALSPFLTQTSVAGTADVDLRLGGSLDAPEPLGRIDLADVSARARLFPHALTGLGGTILFDPQGLRLENVSAELAGGTLTATGSAALGQRGLADVDVKLEGRELNLRYPEGLRSRATLDLALTGRSGALLLSGEVHADRGRYDIDTVLQQSLKGTPAPRSAEPSPLLRSVALDVRVITDSPVVVRHDVMNVEASGSVTARGDLETPAPFGRFALAEGGTIEIQGHEFRVESGSLTYSGTWYPELALRLTASIHSIDEQQDYTVTVTASGPLDSPNLTFTSEPATHSEAEVLSLISTGRLDTGAAESVGRLAGNQLAFLMTSRITGSLARGLGLDRVSLQPELLSREKEPGARFTFEKQLARRLRLIQSYSLNDPEARFTQLEADLPMSVKLLGQRDDDGLLTAGVGQKLRFGGPDKPKAPRRERRAPLDKVLIEGAPAGTEDALRGLIRTKEDGRAGTGRLQDDAEAIRLELVKRGYIEAETSARLKDRVATFGVRPGPHFSTRVEGAPVPSGLGAALRDSLYEDEALDRGKALVLEQLRKDGFLRAAVGTETEADGNERVLVFRAEPGQRFTSVSLRFPGAAVLSDKDLSGAGGGPAAFLVEPGAALQRVRQAYGEALLLSAQAGPVSVEEGPGSVTITVPVDEGPKARIGALDVEGSSRPAGEIESVARLEAGSPYVEDEVVAAVARVRDHYLAAGYPGIRVVTDIKTVPPDIELTLRLDEGAQLTIGPIEIQGAEHTRVGLIKGTLHFQEGDPLDVRALMRAERRLLALGIFTRASITYARENPAKVTVDLQEQAPLAAAYQVRYNADDHLSGEVDAERGNLFGRGLALGGRIRLGGNIREQRLSIRIPSFFHGDLVTSLFRVDEDLPIDANDPDSEKNNALERGFDLQQKVPLGDLTNLLLGYRFKRSTLTSPLLFEPITVSISTLDSSLVRDSRDFVLDATRGRFLSLNLEYSPELLGSDLSFVKSFAQAFFYKRLSESLVWGQAYRTGLAWTFGGQDLIPEERFRAGGASSVRGYATDSLGPRDFLDDPAGGNATLVMNQELRYRHRSGVGGVVFWDAGNVFARVEDIDFDLKHSLGIGLRWTSPVGLLRFDLGHALQPDPGARSWRYYFSFGQSF
jgi:outer membrane protein assembly factor BamA/autotransporter translocation and assembly factor TamB